MDGLSTEWYDNGQKKWEGTLDELIDRKIMKKVTELFESD
jgi:hypothetical protein